MSTRAQVVGRLFQAANEHWNVFDDGVVDSFIVEHHDGARLRVSVKAHCEPPPQPGPDDVTSSPTPEERANLAIAAWAHNDPNGVKSCVPPKLVATVQTWKAAVKRIDAELAAAGELDRPWRLKRAGRSNGLTQAIEDAEEAIADAPLPFAGLSKYVAEQIRQGIADGLDFDAQVNAGAMLEDVRQAISFGDDRSRADALRELERKIALVLQHAASLRSFVADVARCVHCRTCRETATDMVELTGGESK